MEEISRAGLVAPLYSQRLRITGGILSHFLLVQTLNGLSFAALLFLLSSGLSLIYGVMKIVNMPWFFFYGRGLCRAFRHVEDE